MEDYLKDKESKWYNIPDNVVAVLIDPTTGKCNRCEIQCEHEWNKENSNSTGICKIFCR